ncbi:MAG: phosphatase PAP2 family protein [Candidatus Zixiibacteriota bacterium]
MHQNRHTYFILIAFLLSIFVFDNGIAYAEQYLSAGEISGVAAGSVTIGYLGAKKFQIDVGDKSRIRGPLPKELGIHKFLAGKYTSGRTNFLDNEFGSALTPIFMGTILAVADFTWPVRDTQKDVAQDMTLFLSGMITTKGITDFTKGTIRRPRPYAWMADSSHVESEKDYKYLRTSFFSGHSSSAFYSAAFTNLRLRSIMRMRLSYDEYREWRWAPPTVLFGWATYVAWTRIHAYKHYPSDVLVGALVGWGMAELFYSWALQGKDKYFSNSESTPMIRVSLRF